MIFYLGVKGVKGDKGVKDDSLGCCCGLVRGLF
jgi:hypothetical protein